MINIVSSKVQLRRLNDREVLKYLDVPELSYDVLRNDFKVATHLKTIDSMDFSKLDGVIVKCKYLHTGLTAAQYIIRKFESDIEKNKDFNDEFEEDEEYCDEEDDEEEENNTKFYESDLYNDNLKMIKLPMINENEFFTTNRYLNYDNRPVNFKWFENSKDNKKPYWFNTNFPIVVIDHGNVGPSKDVEAVKVANRFIIFVNPEFPEPSFVHPMYNNQEFEKELLFEMDFEIIEIKEPDLQYYEKVFKQKINNCGLKLKKNTNINKIIDGIKNYRKNNFEGINDFDTIIEKIKKRKKGVNKLGYEDFDKYIELYNDNLPKVIQNEYNPYQELDSLIGLDNVKMQLKRSINKIKFEKERVKRGLTTNRSHLALVFMGSPGTAKTTVARIFGSLLCKEGILKNDEFLEISRKDLIGKYVGWTAPQVESIFEKAKGGVIFIDEAYSLLEENGSKSFAEEAMAEIIRQMENNPDTLVIFAGYTEKMKEFIKNANPGLRSRITNMIQFDDYSPDEMFQIFNYLLKREGYKLENEAESEKIVVNFIRNLNVQDLSNVGNGRLMRKLLKTSIEFLAQRENNDLITITLEDINEAANVVAESEKLVEGTRGNKKLGFIY